MCYSLSYTHPSNLSGPEDERKLQVGNRLAKGSCSAVFVIRDPHLQWQNLTFAKSLGTNGEVDKGKLGMSCRERILLELTPEDKVALKST